MAGGFTFDAPVEAAPGQPGAFLYRCPDDAVPKRVLTTQRFYNSDIAFGLSLKFHAMQWRTGPGYLFVHVRFDYYWILSSRGQCGLARIRKYKIESMLDAFEAEWLIPWGPHPAFAQDSENRVELVMLEGRLRVRLNKVDAGSCADGSGADAQVSLLVCGNRQLESVIIDRIGYFDPLAEVPFEGAPCWLEVEIEDRLNTESGAPSAPAKRTVYWLVPLDWANAVGRNVRVRRFVEQSYQRMNAEAGRQGVSYTLLGVRSAMVYEDDIPAKGKRFRLRADGSTVEW